MCIPACEILHWRKPLGCRPHSFHNISLSKFIRPGPAMMWWFSVLALCKQQNRTHGMQENIHAIFFFSTWRHCVAQQTDIHKYITRTTHSHSISTHGLSTFTEQSHLFSMQCGWMWLSVRSNKPFHLRTFFFVIFFLYFLWLIQQQKKLKWKTTTKQIEKQKKNNSVGYH